MCLFHMEIHQHLALLAPHLLHDPFQVVAFQNCLFHFLRSPFMPFVMPVKLGFECLQTVCDISHARFIQETIFIHHIYVRTCTWNLKCGHFLSRDLESDSGPSSGQEDERWPRQTANRENRDMKGWKRLTLVTQYRTREQRNFYKKQLIKKSQLALFCRRFLGERSSVSNGRSYR